MEFYIHDKDDRKVKTSVNLATTFKMDDINYIVYYNTQVEKTNIDIYIGKIKYGDQCLVINKVDSDKQTKFLSTLKSILSGKKPETDISDYYNIIDTATIVLESVQKIKIQTSLLELLQKYKEVKPEIVENKKSDEEIKEEKIKEELKKKEEEESKNDDKSFVEDLEKTNEHINKDLSGLDSLINKNEDDKKKRNQKNKEKENRKISLPILIMLILSIIVAIIYGVYYLLTNYDIHI